MTPAEAREIDRLEFAAEAAAIRQRAYALVQSSPPMPAAPKPIVHVEPKPRRQKPGNLNGRPVKRYTVGGITLTIPQWATRLNMTTNAIYGRVKKGWTIEQALATPLGARRPKDTVH